MNNNVKAIILALVASVSGVTMNVLIKFSDLIFYLENQNIYAYYKKTKKEFTLKTLDLGVVNVRT